MSPRSLSLLFTLVSSLAVAEPAPLAEMEPVFPQQQSAGDVLKSCASSRLTSVGRERRRYCAGFVSGVEETVRLVDRSGKSDLKLCTPANVTASTLAEAFVRYAASHEGELRDPAADVVLQALLAAFPCHQ